MEITVTIPYEKIQEDGEVTFTLEWQKVIPATQTSPQEGGYWEIIEMEGNVLDDDLPDIEVQAYAEADEIARAM
jgi:hypothetical protein